MTLSTDQCIEVAEKIWGWKLQEVDAGFISTKVTIKVWYRNGKRTKWIESNTKDLVNSWQGFGRTVEAMAKDHCMRFLGDRFAGYNGSTVKSFPIQQPEDWDDMKSLIESTHLAALEALKI